MIFNSSQTRGSTPSSGPISRIGSAGRRRQSVEDDEEVPLAAVDEDSRVDIKVQDDPPRVDVFDDRVIYPTDGPVRKNP